MRQWIAFGVSLILLVLASSAHAQTRAAMLKEMEASMLLTGRIDVAADGTVTAYSIDRQDEVPEDVRGHIARNVARWQVHPAMRDGAPVASSSRFSMRLVARRHDERDFTFNIVGVHIDEDLPERERLKAADMAPPMYPARMVKLGGTGTVYIVAKVGLDGRVIDTHVERFNLTVLARKPLAGRIQSELSAAALKAAATWTLRVPAGGPGAGRDYYVVRIPVDFMLGDDRRYGTWTAYIPGQRNLPPWRLDDDDGNDALVPGSATLAGRGMRLASALEPDGS